MDFPDLFPVDESIKVYKDLPQIEGATCRIDHFWGYDEAHYLRDKPNPLIKNFYYCSQCEGWIEGYPKQEYINNINPFALAGRQGHARLCKRCGWELSFSGLVS